MGGKPSLEFFRGQAKGVITIETKQEEIHAQSKCGTDIVLGTKFHQPVKVDENVPNSIVVRRTVLPTLVAMPVVQ
jgi:hypothetical protein